MSFSGVPIPIVPLQPSDNCPCAAPRPSIAVSESAACVFDSVLNEAHVLYEDEPCPAPCPAPCPVTYEMPCPEPLPPISIVRRPSQCCQPTCQPTYQPTCQPVYVPEPVCIPTPVSVCVPEPVCMPPPTCTSCTPACNTCAPACNTCNTCTPTCNTCTPTCNTCASACNTCASACNATTVEDFSLHLDAPPTSYPPGFPAPDIVCSARPCEPASCTVIDAGILVVDFIGAFGLKSHYDRNLSPNVRLEVSGDGRGVLLRTEYHRKHNPRWGALLRVDDFNFHKDSITANVIEKSMVGKHKIIGTVIMGPETWRDTSTDRDLEIPLSVGEDSRGVLRINWHRATE